MKPMRRQLCLLFLTALLTLCFSLTAAGQVILTPYEESGYTEYTKHEQMLEYLQTIQSTTTEMLLSTFGASIEGRLQPYAVFSRPLITQPWEAMACGKPIVVLAANVHGGEKTIRESLLVLVRELAEKGSETNRFLDDLVIIVAPTINPDGAAMSNRGNTQGVDMNRDYMKLDQPALYNFVHNILLEWRPHVFIDGHNGGSFPYNICYQGPSSAATDQSLIDYCDFDLLPFVNREMEKNGYKSFYYTGGDSTQWRAGAAWPRMAHNYSGLINTIGILWESPGGHDRETGVKSGLVSLKAVLRHTVDNADKLMTVIQRARKGTIEIGQNPSGEFPVKVELIPEDFKVSYEIAIYPGGRREGETREERNARRKLVKINNVDLIKKEVATKTRTIPYAYVLEARAHKAIEMLKRQRVMIEVLQKDVEIPVEAYIGTTMEQKSEYDHPSSVEITLADTTHKTVRTFPKGTYIIRSGQMMGRVVCFLLEPETTDNVVKWNAVDALLPSLPRPTTPDTPQIARPAQRGRRGPAIIPIFKVMRPIELPTKMLEYK